MVAQLAFLSEYLGELMIMLFEERKSRFMEMLLEEDEQLRVDAQQTTQYRQKTIMLDLLDVYWANFLSVSYQRSMYMIIQNPCE